MPGNPIYLEEIFFSGGLATVVHGSDLVHGSLNAAAATVPVWTSSALAGDTISIGSTRHYILEIVDDNTLRLSEPWSGPSAGPTVYTGVHGPWHLDGRSIAYLVSKFLQGDATASQTAVQARDDAIAARFDAIVARDLSQAWANRAQGQDVTTPGTRSSLHWATSSSTSATASEAARAASVIAKDAAAASATRSADWAEKPVDTDVAGAGTRSALHHEVKAGQANAAAQAAKADTIAARDIAVAKAGDAENAADAAAIDALATAADRVQTGLDRARTVADASATAADRVQTGLDKAAATYAAAAVAADRVQTGLDRAATTADAIATASDRVQAGLDKAAASASAAIAAASAAFLNFPDYGDFSGAPTGTSDFGDFS